MNREKIYISTVAKDACNTARKYDLGIEIADFCTAWNMDDEFNKTHNKLEDNIKGICRRLLHAPFNELFPCAIDRKVRDLSAERYKQALLLADRYNASKVIIHGGYNPYLYYHQWYVEQSVLFWKKFMSEIPENVHIVLENVLEETPELLLDIVKMVDDPRLRICLDVGHVNAYSKIPVLEWLECCGNFVSHFHLHNNDGTQDSHNGLEQGIIPIGNLIKCAEKICPDATYTLELLDAEMALKYILN